MRITAALLAGVALASLLTSPSRGGGEIVDRIAATVNDIAIAESEVRRAMAVSALRPEPGESPEAFRSRILEAMIDERLQYDDALRFGPATPDAAEVEAALKKLRDRLTREGKSPDAEFAAADLTPQEVRAIVERQLIIERYLQERFRPIALADEDRAREEYEKLYVPERKAAGLSVPAFETVSEEMRNRSQQRVFAEEVEKWMKDLREKARIAIYRAPVEAGPGRTPVLVSTAGPRPAPTTTPPRKASP
jgi:parvulin-like peptidyl-prolyl isomerase